MRRPSLTLRKNQILSTRKNSTNKRNPERINQETEAKSSKRHPKYKNISGGLTPTLLASIKQKTGVSYRKNLLTNSSAPNIETPVELTSRKYISEEFKDRENNSKDKNPKRWKQTLMMYNNLPIESKCTRKSDIISHESHSRQHKLTDIGSEMYEWDEDLSDTRKLFERPQTTANIIPKVVVRTRSQPPVKTYSANMLAMTPPFQVQHIIHTMYNNMGNARNTRNTEDNIDNINNIYRNSVRPMSTVLPPKYPNSKTSNQDLSPLEEFINQIANYGRQRGNTVAGGLRSGVSASKITSNSRLHNPPVINNTGFDPCFVPTFQLIRKSQPKMSAQGNMDGYLGLRSNSVANTHTHYQANANTNTQRCNKENKSTPEPYVLTKEQLDGINIDNRVNVNSNITGNISTKREKLSKLKEELDQTTKSPVKCTKNTNTTWKGLYSLIRDPFTKIPPNNQKHTEIPQPPEPQNPRSMSSNKLMSYMSDAKELADDKAHSRRRTKTILGRRKKVGENRLRLIGAGSKGGKGKGNGKLVANSYTYNSLIVQTVASPHKSVVESEGGVTARGGINYSNGDNISSVPHLIPSTYNSGSNKHPHIITGKVRPLTPINIQNNCSSPRIHTPNLGEIGEMVVVKPKVICGIRKREIRRIEREIQSKQGFGSGPSHNSRGLMYIKQFQTDRNKYRSPGGSPEFTNNYLRTRLDDLKLYMKSKNCRSKGEKITQTSIEELGNNNIDDIDDIHDIDDIYNLDKSNSKSTSTHPTKTQEDIITSQNPMSPKVYIRLMSGENKLIEDNEGYTNCLQDLETGSCRTGVNWSGIYKKHQIGTYEQGLVTPTNILMASKFSRGVTDIPVTPVGVSGKEGSGDSPLKKWGLVMKENWRGGNNASEELVHRGGKGLEY